MSNSWYGPLDPAPDAGWTDAPPRKGFFTDTSICIGCKACEVACKEWNAVPDDGFSLLGSSYDNTGALGASTWRHVAFIEQAGATTDVLNRTADSALAGDRAQLGTDTTKVDLGMPAVQLPGAADDAERSEFRWLMASNVCKHCTHAGCLDVCPTGALFRTEFGTVVVQDDICNGCGYCVAGCPFGVIDRRVGEKGVTNNAGIAQKCTLCYDRLGDGLQPACSKACPTTSIQFGDLDELRERAQARVEQLQEQGVTSARLYGHDESDGVGGAGAFFLLLDEPEVYGFPPDPVVTTRDLPRMWKKAAFAAATMLAGAVAVFVGGSA
ncbi:MAG: 4Fe-4S dicluster domain-containing protein [Actinomycetes bacterium]